MSERPNKATICSVVFLDLPEQSSKPAFQQVRDKELLKSITDEALKDVAPDDRVLIDTSQGMAIALSGAPEAALFLAMMIRDAVIKHNKTSGDLLVMRAGISIGPVRVSDINGLASIQGEGVNVAEVVKNLAAPNQILVSRAYHDITSGLTDEIAGLFTRFKGEQEAYAVRPLEDAPFVPESSAEHMDAPPLMSRLLDDDNSPRFGLWGSAALVAIVLLVGGFMLFSDLLRPDLGVVIADANPAAPTADVQTVSTSGVSVNSAPAQSDPTTQGTAPLATLETHDAAPNLMDPAGAESLMAADTQPDAAPVVIRRPRATQAAAVQSPSAQPVTVTQETDAQFEVFEFDSVTTTEEAVTEPQVVEPTEETRKVAATPRAKRGPVVEERRLPSGGRHKTVWDAFRESFKQGSTQHVCTQAEIALNQCK